MADLSEPEHGICYYRSQDSLSNFRIKVRLKKITSSGTSLTEEKQLSGNNIPLKNINQKENTNVDVYDEKIFQWQEKVSSAYEFETYSADPLPDDEPIVKSYHNDVKKLKKISKFKPGRLFTYVDHDNYSQQQGTMKFTLNPLENLTFAASKNILARKAAPKTSSGPPPRFNILLEDPTEEQKLQHHFAAPPLEEMYIMADLCSDDTKEEPVEGGAVTPDPKEGHKILCVLTLDSRGVVSMQPDFNAARRPYRIEGPHGRESFEYILEHVSPNATFQDVERDQKLSQELANRHAEMLRGIIGTEFELPPRMHAAQEMLRVMVFGEVVRARDFDYDNLYVHFFVDLPQYWRISPDSLFSGTTQCCATKKQEKSDMKDHRHMADQVAHFAYPFEYELYYEKPLDKDAEETPRWPSIIFEVLSLDDWTRYRTEGYGYVNLPTKPGTHEVRSQCWRPTGNSVINELRRYFVGGTPELNDPSYVAVPPDHQGAQLGKYGVRTESTGQVTFRLNMIHQSRAYLQHPQMESGGGGERLDGTLSGRKTQRDRFAGATTHHSVLNVINAFHRVRAELVQAREHSGVDIVKKPLMDDDDDVDDMMFRDDDDEADKEDVRSAYFDQMRKD